MGRFCIVATLATCALFLGCEKANFLGENDKLEDATDSGSDPDLGDGFRSGGDGIGIPRNQDPGVYDPDNPVDRACASSNSEAIFMPQNSPQNVSVCGDEVVLQHGFAEVKAEVELGSRFAYDLALDVTFATYSVPDGVRIIAVSGAGAQEVIFEQCRIKTASYSHEAHSSAPPVDSHRFFSVIVPAFTKHLIIDRTDNGSPTFLKVKGICGVQAGDLRITSSSSNAYRFEVE